MKDIIIIGAGPAGLSAALYAYRAGLDFVIYEKNYMGGGQVLETYEVDNYLGLPNMNGFDMGMKFSSHLEENGVKAETAEVLNIAKDGDIFSVTTDKGEVKAKTVLVTLGANYRKLGIPGEAEFTGKGASYCATCDGAFYKGKDTVVIGGSYTAVEDAIYLSNLCNKVYLVHRRDKLRAGAILEKRLFECENVEVVWDSVPLSINGSEAIEDITIKNVKTNEESKITVNGVFIAVGTVPNTALIKDMVNLDEYGYVIADESCKTNVEGLFVAGDLRTKPLRQIVTAVSDGANAATSIWAYLSENG